MPAQGKKNRDERKRRLAFSAPLSAGLFLLLAGLLYVLNDVLKPLPNYFVVLEAWVVLLAVYVFIDVLTPWVLEPLLFGPGALLTKLIKGGKTTLRAEMNYPNKLRNGLLTVLLLTLALIVLTVID